MNPKVSTSWVPPEASTVAREVDSLIVFIANASAILFVAVTLVSLYYLWKYRRKSEKPTFTSSISHNSRLEIIWTLIPTVLVIMIFFWGFSSYMDMRVIPANSMQIKITGKKMVLGV